MRSDLRLLFGPAAVAILFGAIAGLAQGVPGYSSVQQTVSEIYMEGSPQRVSFAVMLVVFSACILVFAAGLRRASLDAGHSAASAYLTGLFAVVATGLAFAAYPHPLHNVFGLSEFVPYQASLVLAITWWRDRQARAIVAFSVVMTVFVWFAIAVNLSILDRQGALYVFERPFYGLVQRLLFLTWGVWCAGTGLLLFLRRVPAQPVPA